MRIEYTCPSQSGCERLRIYRRVCGKSRLWEKHVRPNTHGTVEGRLQRTRKIPLAKVGIPSAFRRREDVKTTAIARHHRKVVPGNRLLSASVATNESNAEKQGQLRAFLERSRK